MQLGTRWSVGEEVPSQLPDVVGLAVADVEEDLATQDINTSGWRWTLTWLESKPVLELDDGTTITYDSDADEATITQPEPSDDDLFDDDTLDDDDL